MGDWCWLELLLLQREHTQRTRLQQIQEDTDDLSTGPTQLVSLDSKLYDLSAIQEQQWGREWAVDCY